MKSGRSDKSKTDAAYWNAVKRRDRSINGAFF